MERNGGNFVLAKVEPSCPWRDEPVDRVCGTNARVRSDSTIHRWRRSETATDSAARIARDVAMSLCPSVSLRLCGEKRRPHRSFSRYSAAIRSSSISSTVSPQRAKEKSFSICEVVTIPQTRPRSSKTGPPDEPE